MTTRSHAGFGNLPSVPYLKAKHYPAARFSMPTFRFAPGFMFLLCASASLFVGCGAGTALVGGPHGTAGPGPVLPEADAAVETAILSAADDWLGVPYRFGGTTRDGIDCSAFVRAVYESAYGVRLTRSTRTQVREGVEVPRHALRVGDLVFFRTGPDRRHVGIYLGEGRMLHASSSKDRVLVDDFNQDYFQRTYWTARRLLDLPETPAPAFAAARPSPRPAAPPPAVTPGTSGPARSGW